MLIAYSFDSLAYYGRKFIGYDNVTYGSLKELNDEGKGQEINKSCTFSNGIEITVDGIIFDDNELVAFYKIKSTKEKLDLSKLNLFMKLDGLKPMGYNQRSGQGGYIDDYNCAFITFLEAPAFYEKWMKINISLRIDNTREEKSISFTLDRNKAMKKTVEKKLDAKVTIGDYQVYFEKLKASSLSTYITGKIESLTEDSKGVFEKNIASKEAFGLPHLKFDIETDKAEKVNLTGGNMKTSRDEISFAINGDALPKEFNTLEIKNIRLENQKIIDESFDVTLETKDLEVDDEIIVKEIYHEGNETCVVISSKGVPAIGLFNGDEYMEMLNFDQYKSYPESEEPVERTFRFAGKAKDIKLELKSIVYSVYTDETISIPVD